MVLRLFTCRRSIASDKYTFRWPFICSNLSWTSVRTFLTAASTSSFAIKQVRSCSGMSSGNPCACAGGRGVGGGRGAASFFGRPRLALAVVVRLFAAIAAFLLAVYPLIIRSSARSGTPGPSGVRTAVRPSGQLGLLPSGLHRECTILLQVGLWSFMEFHKNGFNRVQSCSEPQRLPESSPAPFQ